MIVHMFGKGSRDKLQDVDLELEFILKESLKLSMIDFGIAEGHRTAETQLSYYKAGKSKLDGVNKLSKHQSKPSKAVDIYAYYSGKAHWDVASLCYIAGIIQATAIRLYDEGKVKNIIRWGGNWDGDGVIVHDQSFDDLCHFELRRP